MNETQPATETSIHSDTITVTLRWFSVLAEKRGLRTESLTLEKGRTVQDLSDALAEEFEAFRQFRSHIRTGVNQRYVDAGTVLNDGDEVAFITPVSGG